MIPVACPSPLMAALLSQPGITERPHMAVQAAVWAIANNSRALEVRRALRSEPGAGHNSAERNQYAEAMLDVARQLLIAAGLEPTSFRLFR